MDGLKNATRTAMLGATVLLTACVHAQATEANSPKGSDQVDLESLHVYEAAPATSTRYRFEFECAKSPQIDRYRVTIEGSVRDVPEPERISRIERVSVDSHDMSAKDLARVNRLLPPRSVQERPWIACSKDAIEVAIRVPADASGTGPVRFEIDGLAKLMEMADGE